MYAIIASSLLIGALAAPLQTRQQGSLWQPAAGEKWQIVISQPVDTSATLAPQDAGVFDVDLFYHTAEDVAAIKAQGKKVICYFSAGSSENWRPDYKEFSAADMGEGLQGWAGENWLNIRSDGVLNIMKERINQASQKGCDAIDPDNMDGYSNGGGGFSLTQEDSVKYLQEMASYAAGLGMATGLKNAQEILSEVTDIVQFAVNEQCSADSGCTEYDSFLATGKPVFHIEYVNDNGKSGQGKSSKVKRADITTACADSQLSTVVKYMALDGWVEYCDGSQASTAINENYKTGDPKQGGDPANPSNPSDPSNPSNPSGPTEPSDPSDPSNPSDPSDGRKPH